MHEWALAEAVIYAAKKAAKDGGLKKITSVTAVFGELQNIDVPAFRSLFNEIKTGFGPELAGARLIAKKEKARFRCRNCSAEFGLKEGLSHDEKESIHFLPEMASAFLKCPKCSSADFEITKGRGVWIKEIKGETQPPGNNFTPPHPNPLPPRGAREKKRSLAKSPSVFPSPPLGGEGGRR